MKSIAAATAAYDSPKCKVIGIDIQKLICTSTEGYSVNPDGPREEDWV